MKLNTTGGIRGDFYSNHWKMDFQATKVETSEFHLGDLPENRTGLPLTLWEEFELSEKRQNWHGLCLDVHENMHEIKCGEVTKIWGLHAGKVSSLAKI